MSEMEIDIQSLSIADLYAALKYAKERCEETLREIDWTDDDSLLEKFQKENRIWVDKHNILKTELDKRMNLL